MKEHIGGVDVGARDRKGGRSRAEGQEAVNMPDNPVAVGERTGHKGPLFAGMCIGQRRQGSDSPLCKEERGSGRQRGQARIS